MDQPMHRFHALFAQLGLPSDELGIRQFITQDASLAPDVKLDDAAFWTPAQATFLREALVQDADWAEQVDQLNEALHGQESK
ncbi:MAG: DUF2789 domain-containing protein [Rhodoferax sp.]